MAIAGNGQGIDITMKAGGQIRTSTVGNVSSQYLVVGQAGITTSADFTGYLANNATTLSDTQTAYYAIGINQTLMSANATEMQVRVVGVSKARCAASVTAGDYIVAYDGVSTTTFAGHIVSLSLINETNQTCATYGTTVTVIHTVLGRALEDGSTNTVISVLLNPQLYGRELWAHS